LSIRSIILALIASAALAQTPENPAEEAQPEALVASQSPSAVIDSVVPAGSPYRPLTAEERWQYYVRHTYTSPSVYFHVFGAGLVEQLANRPLEWGQGTRGYTRRSASAFGRFTLSDTYESASAAVLGHEVRYVRCRCSGFGPRLGYALASSLLTRDREGRTVPAAARIGGAFAAEYTARLWLPQGYQSDSRIARSMAFQTGFRGFANALREFAPELKRVLRRR
jgi:hypothetical protein